MPPYRLDDQRCGPELHHPVAVVGHAQSERRHGRQPAAHDDDLVAVHLHGTHDEVQRVALPQLLLHVVVLGHVREQQHRARHARGVLHVLLEPLQHELQTPIGHDALHNVILDRATFHRCKELLEHQRVRHVLPQRCVDQRQQTSARKVLCGVEHLREHRAVVVGVREHVQRSSDLLEQARVVQMQLEGRLHRVDPAMLNKRSLQSFTFRRRCLYKAVACFLHVCSVQVTFKHLNNRLHARVVLGRIL
mmetsp:Transcript_39247/g.92557  ORF Transcript_39247/g.92557 Transcript_39247/m.92557 type:complete len:248 (-) Transcript_39247:582-1325(-)